MTHLTAQSSVNDRLIGLERGRGEDEVTFELVAHLCRGDAALYGGTAIAATLAAMELVTGRPALWTTVQLVASARLGDVFHCEVERVARGTYIDQVRVNARVDDQLVFTAVGSTATERDHGIDGTGPTMPDAVGPEAGVGRLFPRGMRWSAGNVGHHLVSEFLDAPRTDGAERSPGHLVMWARLTGEHVTTAAKLGFLADMGVPRAISGTAGVVGGGTSLDNSLRVGHLVDSEWVLMDVHGHVARGGYGYGIANLWSPDGVLLGTASQSVKLRRWESPTDGGG
jgi:acyl-CoA thioesterase